MLIVVPFIRSTGLTIVGEVNLRCGDFMSEKICRHSTGSFSLFLVLTTGHHLSFHNFERQSCLFDVDNAFLFVDVTWECLIFDFSFFLWNHVFLCVDQ